MLAPSSSHLSMPGSAAGGAGAALAGAAFASSTMTGVAAGELVSAPPAPPSAPRFKCVSFMRHSIATHNEAAARSSDAMESVYLSEAYADSSLSHRGQALVRGARQAMAGLSPAPSVVLCSPLTRAIQTAIAMFGGTRTRIVAVPGAREAYGRFPCDRHRDRSELELMFGDSVDFSLCDEKDATWSPYHREEMSQLNNRVSRFLESLLQRREEHVFVVSHGVFMEAAIQQLTFGYPGDISKQRVHNCEVHSFVFSTPPSSTATAAAASALSSTPQPLPPTASMGAVAAPATGTATVPSALPLGTHARTLTVAAAAAAAAAVVGRTTTTTQGSGAARREGVLAVEQQQRNGRPSRPKVEAYLTGQGLALACAAEMPLPDVAHVNSVVRRFSGDGRSLTEPQFSMLLARCGLATQETRWLYCALDREGGGRVASGDFVMALMAFYSAKKVEAAAAGVRARVGLMDLRMRYQREMYGTPLSNLDLLEATFKRILSTVLAAP